MSGPVTDSWPPGALLPRPGRATPARMLAAQTAMELRLTLRRGESVLLTFVIPLGLLVLLTAVPVIDLPGRRVDFLVPGLLAVAVVSSAFTGQAIATGFERQYGVLKRLGATALSRPLLLSAKTAAVVVVEALQVAVLAGCGLLLGWQPRGSLAVTALLLLLGTAAFSGLGLLLAGTLRAEATLAAANLIYLVLLGTSGAFFPLGDYPAAVRPVLELLPLTALVDALRSVLLDGGLPPAGPVLVLVGWAVAGLAAAAATFRWE